MTVKPFPGIRPAKKYATLLNVPPYDVVTREEVRNAVKDNPYSFFHVTRSDAEIPALDDEYSPAVYSKARENFESFINKNIMTKDLTDCFYLLSQTWNYQTQTGLYAAVSCGEYENNLIKKHENTRKDKETDRTMHIRTVKADTGPVFLAFDDRGIEIDGYINIVKPIMEKIPVYNFIDENQVENKLWVITEKQEIKNIESYFRNTGAFYIADGHHRAASAFNAWKESITHPEEKTPASGYFMAVIFPASQLNILPYNRLIRGIKDFNPAQFLKDIENSFNISTGQDSITPGRKGTIGLYMGGVKYHLTLRDNLMNDDVLESLDVSILQKYIFAPVFGINDPRTSENLIFAGGGKAESYLTGKVDAGEADAAFSLYPVEIGDLMTITLSSRLMPPKSTWFEPKLRDGLVVYSLD
ncbi:MAG: DUF1015 family protein [Brevinematales bacterium]